MGVCEGEWKIFHGLEQPKFGTFKPSKPIGQHDQIPPPCVMVGKGCDLKGKNECRNKKHYGTGDEISTRVFVDGLLVPLLYNDKKIGTRCFLGRTHLLGISEIRH